MSPAMEAVVRVFRRIARLPDNDDDDQDAVSAYSSVRLLVPGTQALSLIGKQGSIIKSIVQNSGASVRILSQGNYHHHTHFHMDFFCWYLKLCTLYFT